MTYQLVTKVVLYQREMIMKLQDPWLQDSSADVKVLRFQIAAAFSNRSCDSNAAAFSECDISSDSCMSQHTTVVMVLYTQRTPDAMITSSLSQNYIATSIDIIMTLLLHQMSIGIYNIFCGSKFREQQHPGRRSVSKNAQIGKIWPF